MTTRPGSIPERSTAASSAVAQRSTCPRQLGVSQGHEGRADARDPPRTRGPRPPGVPTAERASGGGAAIRQVVPDAPANDAGLRDGDHRTIEVRLGEQPRRAP